MTALRSSLYPNAATGTTSTRLAAEGYIRRGWAPVPIPRGRKGPKLSSWQTLRLQMDDVPRFFTEGQNIGILTGEPSGGLIDVDLDVPEAVAVAGDLLPDTLKSGRGTKPNSHRWYRCDPIPQTIKFQAPRTGEGPEMFVELRSTGKQTVVAPSIHPDGDVYGWGEGEVLEIPGRELVERVREVATAALLVRSWHPGGRHELALAAAGYLGRRLAQDRVVAILGAAAAAAGDEEWRDRAWAVQDTLYNLQIGRRVTGGPTLEQLAPGVTEVLARWWGWQKDPPNGRKDRGDTRGFNRTDLGNAERLVAREGDNIRYSHEAGKWFCWDGRRWAEDRTGKIRHMARETVRQIGAEAADLEETAERKELLKWALSSEAKTRIDAMIGLSEAEAGIPVTLEELDASPWRLNCLNGTIDLKTGELLPHQREDLITKIAPVEYDPEGHSEVWQQHLEFATGGDAALARFLQRAAGYSLTGDVSEEIIFFIHGPTQAGKSTFMEALKATLGEYARTADFETFLARRDTGGVRNDIARLAGARLVASIEVDEGKRLAEGLIKVLTGGDRIAARFLYKEAFEFLPSFKLWLAANHKPKIDPDDEAMWRRVLQIPFDKVIPKSERDPAIKRTLRDPALTGPAVLAWAVEGCLDWQRYGLGVPPAVEAATEKYREEMDPLQDFIADCCVLSAQAWTPTAQLRQAYEAWGKENGTRNLVGPKKFAERLRFHKCEPKADRLNGRVVRGWVGIGLRSDVDTLTDVDT